MNKVVEFIKREAVLLISLLLAVASVFFVKPSSKYIEYIDFKTLCLLFCLMTVMAGLQEIGVFKLLAYRLLSVAKTTRSLYFVLTLLCFFSSMLITNDVALLTFVPFTVTTLNISNQRRHLAFVTVMQTVAANLGSMLTPVGNPQNLYLFSRFNLSAYDFFSTVFPYCALSLVLLIICGFFIKNEGVNIEYDAGEVITSKPKMISYFALFLLSLLCVFRVLSFVFLLVVVLAFVLVFDRKTIMKIDYSLLLTFVFLFIFIGNLGNIDYVSAFLQKVVNGNEVAVGVLSSQMLSNVPAAILLSAFTDNAKALLIGVNLGGLGTLIASMASLISFKLVQKQNVNMQKYILLFTLVNLIFLALNCALCILIS